MHHRHSYPVFCMSLFKVADDHDATTAVVNLVCILIRLRRITSNARHRFPIASARVSFSICRSRSSRQVSLRLCVVQVRDTSLGCSQLLCGFALPGCSQLRAPSL